MQTLQLDQTAVTDSQDEMTAYLRLPEPLGEQKYTLEDVINVLTDSGVKTGFDKEAIVRIIQEGIYDQPIVVAEGKKPTNGTDGYYEYRFERNLDTKPKVNPDGSVSYAIKLFERDSKVLEDLKLNKEKIPELIKKNGFYPAYHMNKKYWITLSLNEVIKDEDIMKYLDESYQYTIKNKVLHK